MTDPRFLPSLLGQYALACNMTSAYYMLTMGEGMPGWFYPQMMLIYAPVLCLINRLFLRRERTLLFLSVLNAALCGAAMCAYFLLEPWRGIAYAAFVVIFLLWLTVRGVQTALKGPALRSILLTLDVSFVLLVAFVGYSSATGLALKWSIPALSGLCAAMFAAACLRSSQPLSPKGLLATLGAFSALFLLLWLLLGAAAPAGHGLVAVWNLMAAGVGAIKKLILRGILWLLSLLPDSDPGEMGWAELGDYAYETEELPAEEANPIWGVILLVIAAAGTVFLLIWLVRQLKSIRLRRTGGVAPASLPPRERTPLLQGLRRLIGSCLAAVRLRFRLYRGRNSAPGLYFLLVHRCRRAPWHKRPGETPREFLLRLAASAGEDTSLADALRALSKETDVALYSGHPGRARLEYAPIIRRRIGAASRKQFFRQLLDTIRPDIKKSAS